MDYDRLTRRQVLGTISVFSLSGCLGTVLDTRSSVDPPSTIDGTWKTARSGAQNRNAQHQTTSVPQFVWSESSPLFIEGAPIIAGGSIFVSDTTGDIYRLNGRTGDVMWKTTIDNESFTVSVAINNGMVLASGTGGVYGLDSSSGERRWTRPTPGPASSVNFFDGDAYFTAGLVGRLYRLDPHSGSVRWHTAIPGSGIIPAVDSDFVYSVGVTGDFFVHDRHTGKKKLQYPLADGVSHPVVLNNNLAIIGTMSGVVYGIDIQSEKFIQWTYRTGRNKGLFAPTIQNEVVYIADETGRLVAIDSNNGTKIWATVLGETVDYASVNLSPSCSSDMLYALGPNQQIHSFDITGSSPTQVKTIQPNEADYATYPSIAGNMLFIAGSVVAGYRIS